jgi:hypothetical protein
MPRENVELVRRGFDYVSRTGKLLREGAPP